MSTGEFVTIAEVDVGVNVSHYRRVVLDRHDCAATDRDVGPATDTPTPVRVFQTGATRDSDGGKLDIEGFLSPAVLLRFSEFMHKHRRQADGALRASDNWQRGIPAEQYAKSLVRHTVDAWAKRRGGRGVYPAEPLDDVLCAIMFNAMGWLSERLHGRP